MSLKNILIITKKELRGFFDSPTAYIVLIVFLSLWEFLFFRAVFLIGEASLRILFDSLLWLSILLIPAVTMGSISQERGDGTLEFLLTHPLRDREFLIGKFFGSIIFVAVALIFIFPLAVSLDIFGNLDWGVVIAQFFGSLFFTAVLVSLGIFISSLFTSQISSLLVSAVFSFLFIIAGLDFITQSLPSFLVPIFERVSILSHFESMSRGLIDLRDVWYFISAIIIFLSLTYLQLLKRRFGNLRSAYHKYRIGIGLFIGIAVLTNVVGHNIPGRLDLTQGRIYTLSETTHKTLSELNDFVNITLYFSKLPSQLQPVLRDTEDMLRDYRILGKGNINITYKDPLENPQVREEAASLGIREVSFNVIGRGELQLQKGYLGLAVSYAGKTENIPFIQNTSDLEYRLTGFIKKLTAKERKKVVFLSGHGEKSIYRDYRALRGELEKQFDIEEFAFDFDKDKKTLPEKTDVLVIAGPSQKIDDNTRSVIKEFISHGGAGLFLIDSVAINPQYMMATPINENFSDFLKDFGIDVQQDIVYDIRSNETLSFRDGFASYMIPYPFWARVAAMDAASPVTSKIESIILPWASSIVLNDTMIKEKGFTASRLFSTTRFGGAQTGNFSIAPQQRFNRDGLGEKIVAVSLTGKKTETGKTARLVAVGDSDFITDQFAMSSPSNIAFGISALSWLGEEGSLASILIKQRGEHRLLFENDTQIVLVKYGNMTLAIVVPLAFGVFRLIRRQALKKMGYSSLK